MNSITKIVDATIDPVDYIVRLRIDYEPGEWAIDPTERTDSKVTGHEILNIDAYNNEIELFYTVNDPDEIEKVENEIDIEDEFNNP